MDGTPTGKFAAESVRGRKAECAVQPGLPQVKIVILSGYSDFKYLNMSIRNHVAEYLLKPTDIDDFEETFRRLKASMDHERLRRAQITESVLRHFHA